ncbi:MAG: NmrA family NAD(P)-binding protein [Labilithrix sp.]|nr:NmrA family NAD(P)-binding protein [Labilithrix sp.]MCW5836089.1 NmrA family NAD(P)-binding protein [Labilithrix sp.]
MFVVAGVTGKTGSIVAETLLAAGKKVRVLVRDAAKGAPWEARGAEVRVLASLDDSTALAAALEGAEGAYLLSPPSMGAEDFLAERRVTVDALAAAVERSRVPHVVFLSSVGGQHPGATGPIRTVHYGERRLAETGAKLTFVRAAYFLENWAAVVAAVKAGKLPTFIPADRVIPMVATRDIGAVAAKALLDGPPASKVDVLELAGAKDLSAKDVAAIFGRLVGRSVEAEEAPLDAVVPTFTSFGASTSVAGLFREMYEGIARGTVTWEGSPNARLVRGTTDPESVLRAFV